ncbi:methyltransferase domain-containing protein [Anaerospora sp.]|uniref:class I SAM-dependent DNA methyltransferase n=1 Tax=Anaerospora sp. TaxID=1960278 RepID=UPI002896B6EF|nr:methyltransferase domain-containing protein [Anaerospora sp.]
MAFDKYAHYYDLLYRDKDYIGEANYIDSLIRKYNIRAENILDLGCGTGKHAELLSQKGYKVHGVDMSEGMLQEAYIRAENNPNLSFTLSNLQEFNLEEKFDVATALFHVMSYQTSNSDLYKAFSTAYEQLLPGGIFIFDCWYGPAVLSNRPVVRVKRLEDAQIHIARIAEPVMHPNSNLVDVNYHMYIKDKEYGTFGELQEVHTMRYLFRPEVELLLEQVGFCLIDSFEFITGKTPGYDTWNVCFVGQKGAKQENEKSFTSLS